MARSSDAPQSDAGGEGGHLAIVPMPAVLRARHRLAALVGRYPRLYLPLARLGHRIATRSQSSDDAHPPVVNRHTEVVIEGFPRSANSFAVAAFRLAQPGPVRIAHHRHAPAQIVEGVRLGIPTIVLVRRPTEAVAAFIVSRPEMSVALALRSYVGFYARCLPHASGFIVADFQEVTSNFGPVVSRLNRRFGTSFEPFHHTPANVAECFRQIDDHYRSRFGFDASTATLARPDPGRDQQKEDVFTALRSPQLRPLLDRAEELHEELVGKGSTPSGGPGR